MVDGIPNFKVGMDLNEVEQYVKNSNLDQKVKQSIFNFINEDREIGDGLITNRGELQMLKNLMTGRKDMPSDVFPENNGTITGREYGETITGAHYSRQTVTNKVRKPGNSSDFAEETTTLEFKVGSGDTKWYQYDENPSKIIADFDLYTDENNDNVMDHRITHLQKENLSFSYTDEDADGSYDKLRIYDSSTKKDLDYVKDEQGNWRLK